MVHTNMAAFSGIVVPPQVTHIWYDIFSEIKQFRHINMAKVISYWRHFEDELGLYSYPRASCSVQMRQTALSLPIKFSSLRCFPGLLIWAARIPAKYILRTLHPHVVAIIFLGSRVGPITFPLLMFSNISNYGIVALH